MNFFALVSPRGTGGRAVTDFSEAEPVHRGEAPRCTSCGGFVGMLPWLPPYRAELEVWGNEYGDIAFAPANELLVSERFATLYRAESLTGLEGFGEVEIHRVIRRGGSKLRRPPPKYYCVHIVRSRAAINQAASEFIHERPIRCDECRVGSIKRWSKIVMEERTWSGEDLFFARGLPGTIMTSERFKEFFGRNRMNNGILVAAAAYSHDFYPWEKTSEPEQQGGSVP